MGMFDSLTIDREFNLPLPSDLQGISLEEILQTGKQTKSFDCTLSVYLLRADGVVYYCVQDSNFERQWVPYTEHTEMSFHSYIEDGDKNVYISWDYNMLTKECKLVDYRVRNSGDNIHARALKRSRLLNKWYMRPYLWYRSVVRCVFRTWRENAHKIPKAWEVETWLTPL